MKTQKGFDQVIEKGCGLDVHQKEVVVTIMGTGVKTQTRTFSTYTRSLISLREWLLKHGITPVMIGEYRCLLETSLQHSLRSFHRSAC